MEVSHPIHGTFTEKTNPVKIYAPNTMLMSIVAESRIKKKTKCTHEIIVKRFEKIRSTLKGGVTS